MSRWTIEEGLSLVRALQPETRQFGYHLALGGGVLNKGESEKDLDLYFLPLDNTKYGTPVPDKLVAWLEGLWGESVSIASSADAVAPPLNPLPLGGGIGPIPLPEGAQVWGQIGNIERAVNPWWNAQVQVAGRDLFAGWADAGIGVGANGQGVPVPGANDRMLRELERQGVVERANRAAGFVAPEELAADELDDRVEWARAGGAFLDEEAGLPKKASVSGVYKFKLKFTRGGDRIDVFVL